MNWLRNFDWTVPVNLLAQLPPEGGGDAPAGVAPAAGQQDSLSQILLSPMNFMLMLFMLFFLLVLWPQQRQMRQQQKALAEALNNLKKNDRVVTSGGVHGVVVQAAPGASTVTLRIDESTGAKMTVSREAIARVIIETGTSSENKNG